MAKALLSSLKRNESGVHTLALPRALAGLPPASRAWLTRVAAQAEKQKLPLYLVGGFVRDALLGQPSLDLDLVVEGDAISFGRRLVKALGGSLLTHSAFRTAVWTLPAGRGLPSFIDLISARRESYSRPGALPAIEFASIKEDQFRRDFTINTLALRLDGPEAGRLLDPWGGLADLRAGRLRVLHPRSFADDPTRILRILRFMGRLNFRIERETLAQLKASLPQLAAVSGERIYKEIELALAEPKYAVILRAMQSYRVLPALEPGLSFNANMAAALESAALPPAFWDLKTNLPELRLALWLAQTAPAVASATTQRLRQPASLAAAVEAAAALRTQRDKLLTQPPSSLVPFLESQPRLAVYLLHLLNRRNALGRRLLQFAKTWRHVKPGVDGHALRKLGLQPGPQYSRVLGALRAARLDGAVKTNKQEQALLRRMLDERGND
jgi:tRNA nucleotidyltransferase (CCA-adding enzyme)